MDSTVSRSSASRPAHRMYITACSIPTSHGPPFRVKRSERTWSQGALPLQVGVSSIGIMSRTFSSTGRHLVRVALAPDSRRVATVPSLRPDVSVPIEDPPAIEAAAGGIATINLDRTSRVQCRTSRVLSLQHDSRYRVRRLACRHPNCHQPVMGQGAPGHAS